MKQGYIILALLIVCLSLAKTLAADTIKGRVLDAETGEPLWGAKVVFQEGAIGRGGTTIHAVYADSLGRFQYTCCMEMSKLTITASHFGYHDQSVQRMGSTNRDTITIDDFRLKMDEHLLGEVTVEGRARRFYMRGDTVVFNPSAFRTQDGARLLELIEQLPGVSIEDGKLLWNGEPLKLMMNGQEAFSEAMLTHLLPVEAVKDIKAYDKQSELTERTGVGDGKEEHVLDVTVKPRFMDRFYGDVEAKGLTSKNYAAHLRAMRLSDTDPLMLYARCADDPKVVSVATIERNGSWQGDAPVRQQTGALGYAHFWQPAYKAHQKSHWSISGGGGHTDSAHDSWENRQTFMPGSAAAETDQTAGDYRHELKIPVDFASFLNLGPNTMMRLTANVTYRDERKTEDTHGQTRSLDAQDTMLNTSDHHSFRHEESISSSAKAELFGFAGKCEYLTSADITYQNLRADGHSTGNYQYVQRGASQTDHQQFSAPTHDLKTGLRLIARRPLGQQVMLSAEWKTTYLHGHRDEQRHRADTLDLANSLQRNDRTWQNLFHLEANATHGKFTLNPILELVHWHERTDYRRGTLDTLATRALLLCEPSLELTCKLRKQTRLRGHIVYESQRPDLIDCIGYRDDTNPLHVTLGNPQLTTAHTLNASLAFSTMLTRASQVVNLSFGYRKNDKPIGTLVHYDSQTGAYRTQKQNLRGGERMEATLTYEQTLSKTLHVRNHLSESYGQAYGILTLVDDASGITYSRQRSSDLTYNLKLEYASGPLLLRLDQHFSWHHYAYRDTAQPLQDIYNYRADITARHQWKSWTFSLLPTFLLDRGYLAHAMNEPRLLVNASVDHKCLKNKAVVGLHINDLFNRDSRHRSTITATTRTEGGSTLLHHYASLTFRYNLEAKKK